MTNDRPKRVGLLTQHFFPEMVSTGGHMTELARGIVDSGRPVTAYTAQPRALGGEVRLPRHDEHAGIRIHRVPLVGGNRGSLIRRLFAAVTFPVSVAWAVFRDRRDLEALVITTNPPFLGLVGWWARRFLGLPYLFIVYDVYPDIAVRLGVLDERSFAARVWSWISRLILRGADRLVVIGRDMQRIILAKLEGGRAPAIDLIPNWHDETEVSPATNGRNSFRLRHGWDADTFLVQYAGNIGRTHDLRPLIDAAAALRHRDDIQFVIVGEGANKPPLVERAKELSLENIKFLGYQPREELGDMLAAADLSVVCLGKDFTGLSVPSKTYGVMANGVPVLALLESESEIGAVVREVGCGLQFDDPDPETLARKLEELADDRDRAATMGQRGREAYLARFTYSAAMREYANTLRMMLSPSTEATGADLRQGDGDRPVEELR